MLRRSLFDVLCDFWYFSKVKLYLKAILTPLIVKPDPSDVSKYLTLIPKNERKVFFIKGIVYTLPESLQKIFFPKKHTIRKQIHQFLNKDQIENQENEQKEK